jgi:TonB family protein
MRVSCLGTTRLIRSDILDRDMFDSAARTPANTAWTMQLLDKLNQALGPGVMEKPLFPIADSQAGGTSGQSADDGVLREVSQGDYDALFPTSELRLASIYQDTTKSPPPAPTVKLKTQLSVQPEVFAEANYPPLAKMTRTDGNVSVEFEIGPDGVPKGTKVVAGHPLLRAAAQDAIGKWRFPTSAAGQRLQAVFEFALNCNEN